MNRKTKPKEAAPSYQTAFSLCEAFVYLKCFPKGLPSQKVKEKYFSGKDDRSFNRLKRAMKELLFDYQGDPLFFFEGEGNKQVMRLHPKHFTTSDVMEWQLFSLMLSNVMLANVRGSAHDSSDIKGGIQKLRDLILLQLEKDLFKSDAEGRVSHPSIQSDALFSKLKNKFYCKKVGQKIYGLNDESTRILDRVTEAIYQEIKIEILRYKGESRENWKIAPLTLLTYNEAFYVIAQDESKKIILLAIDRISALKPLTKEHFKYPQAYSPAQYLDRGFGVGDVHDEPQEIKLLFHPEVAYLIRERLWHPTQKVTKNLDENKLLLEMNVPDNYELRKFVLSFGSKVQALV